MKKGVIFLILSLLLFLGCSIASASSEKEIWPYRGIKWSNPNTPWVLEQYDKNAESPGSEAWLKLANRTKPNPKTGK